MLNNLLPFTDCIYVGLVQCLFAWMGNSSSHEENYTEKHRESLTFMGLHFLHKDDVVDSVTLEESLVFLRSCNYPIWEMNQTL